MAEDCGADLVGDQTGQAHRLSDEWRVGGVDSRIGSDSRAAPRRRVELVDATLDPLRLSDDWPRPEAEFERCCQAAAALVDGGGGVENGGGLGHDVAHRRLDRVERVGTWWWCPVLAERASSALFSPWAIRRRGLASSSAMVAAMSLVERAVSLASAFTSEATTAKPRPASPARAASIVALSASRLVWRAMAFDAARHPRHLRKRVLQRSDQVARVSRPCARGRRCR